MVLATHYNKPTHSARQVEQKRHQLIEKLVDEYRSHGIPLERNLDLTHQRKKSLQKIMHLLNAYDENRGGIYKLEELCALHHPRLHRPFEKDPSNNYQDVHDLEDWDRESNEKFGKTRMYGSAQFLLPHDNEDLASGAKESRLIPYIHWTGFVNHIPYLYPRPSPLVSSTKTPIEFIAQFKDGFKPGDLPQFDLTQAANQGYRIFYLQKDPSVRWILSGRSDPVTLRANPAKNTWFCIADLLRFYSGVRSNQPEDGDRIYAFICKSHQAQLDQLRAVNKIKSVTRSSGGEKEYMRSDTFDVELLSLLKQSPFAVAICKKLFPTSIFQSAAQSTSSVASASVSVSVDRRAIGLDENVPQQSTIEDLINEFRGKIEREYDLAGYYYKDTEENEFTFYELFKLTTAVTDITNDLSGKWAKSWKLEDVPNGYVVKPAHTNTWFVTIEHFLLGCMKKFKEVHLNEMGKDFALRLPRENMNLAKYPAIYIDVNHGLLVARNDFTSNHYTIEEAVGKITNIVYLRRYFEYQLANLGYPRRVYGDQNDLYEGKHIVHVAGPFGRAVEAEESLNSIEKSSCGTLHNATSRGHVTLQVPNSKGERKETLFLTIDYFINHIFQEIGKGPSCTLANAFRAAGGLINQLYMNGSSQIATGAMENSRQILEQGTDQDQANRAANLQEGEATFADYIDEANEAHHVRTVTGDVSLESSGNTEMELAIVIKDTEKHRLDTAKEVTKQVEAVEKTKQVTKEAIEKTKQVATESAGKSKVAYHELMGIRSHEKAETERERLKAEAETERERIRVEAEKEIRKQEMDDAKSLHAKDFELREKRFLFEQLKWRHENGHHVVEVEVPPAAAARSGSKKTARRSVSPNENQHPNANHASNAASSVKDMPPKYRKKTRSTSMRK